jgi:hypothetical protein
MLEEIAVCLGDSCGRLLHMPHLFPFFSFVFASVLHWSFMFYAGLVTSFVFFGLVVNFS